MGYGLVELAIIVLLAVSLANIYGTSVVISKVDSIGSDLNVLKNNDTAFAQYIVQNSQTLEYLNKNCKVTSDTNETTTLVCIKEVRK
jgi:hypothetical protein